MAKTEGHVKSASALVFVKRLANRMTHLFVRATGSIPEIGE